MRRLMISRGFSDETKIRALNVRMEEIFIENGFYVPGILNDFLTKNDGGGAPIPFARSTDYRK